MCGVSLLNIDITDTDITGPSMTQCTLITEMVRDADTDVGVGVKSVGASSIYTDTAHP